MYVLLWMKQNKYSTKLLNCLWELNDKNTNYNLYWEILCRKKNQTEGNKTCKLCSLKKYEFEKKTEQITP